MSPRTMVLTGPTGFIGGAVLRSLCEKRKGATRIRAVVRGPQPRLDAMPGVECVRADLADAASLRGVCADAETLIHAASYVGRDEARCDAVNRRGTAALMADATASGVRRIVHLSTAAVYGRGPHHGIDVDEVTPAPGSAASRSRLAAEESALAAGALVLRAGLVIGPGDRWVVPALAELARRVPGRWNGGRALLSLVAVHDLARLMTAAADAEAPVRGVHHASHPDPVRNRDLMDALAAHGVLPPLDGDLSRSACLEQLRATEGRVSERQFVLVADDHHYRSDRIWRETGCSPGPGPLAGLGAAARWYRTHLEAHRPG
ncbi:NAD-dependent epimerase/dehydratase family protein [Streptomyces sp. NPDC050161]|uniref:NAD-dependent epimerase/dehydratase family protein n=1 Tax=Streptomyces sp. NPDC050161 TaxID=3365604 RepID=UPI0037B59138